MNRNVSFVRGNLKAGPTSRSLEGRVLYETLEDQASDMESLLLRIKDSKKQLRSMTVTSLDEVLISPKQASAACRGFEDKAEYDLLCQLAGLERALEKILRECRRTIREMERLGHSELKPRKHLYEFLLRPRQQVSH